METFAPGVHRSTRHDLLVDGRVSLNKEEDSVALRGTLPRKGNDGISVSWGRGR